MAEYAKIEGNIVVDAILADALFVSGLPGQWVEMTTPGAGVGWGYNGSVFTAPASPAPEYRQQVTAAEFVELWTDAEWRGLKNLRSTNDRVDQYFDAIQFAGAVDMGSARMTQFLTLLVQGTPLTAARATEISQGILE